jgi:hypothetical protein
MSKFGHFGKSIRNTWKVLKCGTGEGWRRSNILPAIKRRQANGIGHILRRNCVLNHLIGEKIAAGMEVKERQGRTNKQLLDDAKEKNRVLEIEKGSTRSHSVENSFWKRLRTCGKTDCAPMMRFSRHTRLKSK